MGKDEKRDVNQTRALTEKMELFLYEEQFFQNGNLEAIPVVY